MSTHENVLPLTSSNRPAPPPGGSAGVSSELVVARDPFHPRAEELRALRTQLLIRWAQAGAGRRVLLVASASPREGRSYVAANLALAFAQLGERTLLIDADLRAPRQHRIFDAPEAGGLAAVLTGRAGRGALLPMPELGPFSLLPAGRCASNPQELLLGPALAGLLDKLAGEFGVIVIDSPPAKLYADAQGLAFRAGNVVLLARRNHTRMADAYRTARELGVTGARIVGTVFNAF